MTRALGVFSPGSPPRREALEAGLARLSAAGFELRLGRTAIASEGIHAGSPQERADDLHSLLADPAVTAILCTRGGTGTMGLLDRIEYERVPRTGKPIIGLSDATALHLALHARAGLSGIAAPVLVQLGPDLPPYTWGQWVSMVRGPFTPGVVSLPPGTALGVLPVRSGAGSGTAGVAASTTVEGPLFPCNLSLLTSLLGTPYLPSFDGSILVLEEVHETPQSLDRMTSALRLSGVLRKLGGLALGQFTDCLPRNPGVTEEDGRRVVRTWAESLGVPVLHGFPFGHDPLCAALPFGARARLTTDPPGLELLEFMPPLAPAPARSGAAG